MDTLGESDAAINLCEQALAKASTDRDKWILSSCVSDLRGGGTPTGTP